MLEAAAERPSFLRDFQTSGRSLALDEDEVGGLFLDCSEGRLLSFPLVVELELLSIEPSWSHHNYSAMFFLNFLQDSRNKTEGWENIGLVLLP